MHIQNNVIILKMCMIILVMIGRAEGQRVGHNVQF